MKFGKSLSNQIEDTLPEWRDKFLSYKDLKKRLKLVDPSAGEAPSKRRRSGAGDFEVSGGDVGPPGDVSKEEVDFTRLLEDELEKFNAFFVEKEEEYIIRLKELQDSAAKAKNRGEEMMKIRKEIVDFHGEMVLLENYSALNYTGLVKILKKYDKRTGAVIRLPFIQKVLRQPFFTTDLLYKLVKRCEAMLERLFFTSDPSSAALAEAAADGEEEDSDGILRGPKREPAEIEFVESLCMKSTVSALRALKEIRSRSSTVSVFSLPPLQASGSDDPWNEIPVLEQQAAK